MEESTLRKAKAFGVIATGLATLVTALIGIKALVGSGESRRLPDEVARLSSVLQTGHISQRVQAAENLAAFGAEAVSPLAKALSDERLEVQLAALEALGRIGAPAHRGAAREICDLERRNASRLRLPRTSTGTIRLDGTSGISDDIGLQILNFIEGQGLVC